MLREAEPWHFPERSFALLEEIAARIQPVDPSLKEWFSKYCRHHRTRLAADLHLIDGHVEPGARVLEYGAIPLVMTAALTALEYEVSARDGGNETRRYS